MRINWSNRQLLFAHDAKESLQRHIVLKTIVTMQQSNKLNRKAESYFCAADLFAVEANLKLKANFIKAPVNQFHNTCTCSVSKILYTAYRTTLSLCSYHHPKFAALVCMYVCMYTALITHQYVMQWDGKSFICTNRRCGVYAASIASLSRVP